MRKIRRIGGIGILLPAIVVMMAVPLGGCVSLQKYKAKQEEAASLDKSLKELQARCQQLASENEGLKNRYEQLSKENEIFKAKVEELGGKVAELGKENEKLMATIRRPEFLLKALGERLSEMQHKLDLLEIENAKLKVDLDGQDQQRKLTKEK